MTSSRNCDDSTESIEKSKKLTDKRENETHTKKKKINNNTLDIRTWHPIHHNQDLTPSMLPPKLHNTPPLSLITACPVTILLTYPFRYADDWPS